MNDAEGFEGNAPVAAPVSVGELWMTIVFIVVFVPCALLLQHLLLNYIYLCLNSSGNLRTVLSLANTFVFD